MLTLELGMVWKFIQFDQCPPHWALTGNLTAGTRGDTLILTGVCKIIWVLFSHQPDTVG